jgi:serine/threonine-protein kinase
VIGGRYRLDRPAGEGRRTIVEAGYDTRLNRPVAVHRLRAELADDEGQRERFVAEARQAARLSHPDVVAVYDSGWHDGRPFVVTELLSGRTLADELRDHGPLAAERAAEVMGVVLSGLAAAHREGMAHGRLGADRVLLGEAGEARLDGFGGARGPEGGPSEADDLYAAGRLLYELLAGRPPAGTSGTAGDRRRPGDAGGTVDGRLPAGAGTDVGVSSPGRSLSEARPDLSPEVLDVVDRALDADATARYGSAVALARAVAESLPVEPAEPVDRSPATEALALSDLADLTDLTQPADRSSPAERSALRSEATTILPTIGSVPAAAGTGAGAGGAALRSSAPAAPTTPVPSLRPDRPFPDGRPGLGPAPRRPASPGATDRNVVARRRRRAGRIVALVAVALVLLLVAVLLGSAADATRHPSSSTTTDAPASPSPTTVPSASTVPAVARPTTGSTSSTTTASSVTSSAPTTSTTVKGNPSPPGKGTKKKDNQGGD